MKFFNSLGIKNVLTGGVLNLFMRWKNNFMIVKGIRIFFLGCIILFPSVCYSVVCDFGPLISCDVNWEEIEDTDILNPPGHIGDCECTYIDGQPKLFCNFDIDSLGHNYKIFQTQYVSCDPHEVCSEYEYVHTFACGWASWCCEEGWPPEAPPCPGVQCPEGQSIINLENCTCGCYQDYRDACLTVSGTVFDDNACQCNCTLPRIYDLWVDLDCENKVATVYAWNGGENNSLYYPSGRLYRWVNNQELFVSDVSGYFSTANLAPGSYYIVYDEVNVYCSEYSYDWYVNIEIDSACSGGCIFNAPSEEEGPPIE